MQSSPFAIFRKHQKVLMVLLTGMAMFAFVFMDTMTPGGLPLMVSILLFGGLFAAAMWIIGAPRQRGTEFALAGAVLGGVIAYLFFNVSGPPPAVKTSLRDFSPQDLQRLLQRRGLANRFMNEALLESESMQQQFSFGAVNDRDVIYGYLLRHEAEEMGVRISDEAVTSFIREVTQDKLTPEDFRAILKRMGISETEMYSILRDELQTRLAAELLSPPRSAMGVGGLGTPQQYWDYFQKMHIQAEVSAAPVPVEAFLEQVDEPNEAELQAFFDAHKNQVAGPDGTPGFLQPRKVNLTYLAARFEDFEKMVPEITDAEVEEYYQQNKELYQIQDLPDFPLPGTSPTPSGTTPETTSPVESSSPEPASALEPANVTPAANGGAQFNVQDDPQAKSEQADEAPAATTPPEPAPADALQPANVATPNTQTATPTEPKEPRYRELDEDLKAEIRERLRSERALELMGKATQQAQDYMLELATKYAEIVGEDESAVAARSKAAQEIADALQQYAKKNNLHFGETGLVSQQELMEMEQPPLGTAVEPTTNPADRGNARTLVEDAFGSEILYLARRADDVLRNERYAWWKTADVEAHVPTLQEPGVREQVVRAWKMMKARPLAEARAKELAEIVRKSDQPMSTALEGKTVAPKGDQPLRVVTTPRFSWMVTSRTPMSGPLSFGIPELSTVAGIEDPGPEFMQTVFDELDKGEVGVAPNADQSVYYVVKVQERVADQPTGPTSTADASLQDRFMNERMFGFYPFLTPYDFLAERSAEEVRMNWQQQLQEKYDIQWYRNPDQPG